MQAGRGGGGQALLGVVGDLGAAAGASPGVVVVVHTVLNALAAT